MSDKQPRPSSPQPPSPSSPQTPRPSAPSNPQREKSMPQVPSRPPVKK